MYMKSLIAWTVAVLLFTTSNAASIEDDGRETGEIALSDEQQREAFYGKFDFLPAVKLDEHEYSALQPDIDRLTIKPIPRCSDLYKEFMDKYRSIFQSWADKYCRNYIGVWCCPYGGCTLFIVRPYVLCHWTDPIYIPKIPVWEWPQIEIPRVEVPEKKFLVKSIYPFFFSSFISINFILIEIIFV